jgi:hypothetical protein
LKADSQDVDFIIKIAISAERKIGLDLDYGLSLRDGMSV